MEEKDCSMAELKKKLNDLYDEHGKIDHRLLLTSRLLDEKINEYLKSQNEQSSS